MATTTTMPKETLAELLSYLADNEPFDSVRKNLAGAVEVAEVRAALRELALSIKREAAAEGAGFGDAAKRGSFTRKSKALLSCLSSLEEEKLMKAFGFPES
jgi:hypothetical protein